ncbi:MAG: DUF3472 domain-containing protein [Bacteroidaceae bacterium]|nr:DUF3472 domain-containing protein [Bacteroidaceae bacterium]
MKKTLLSIICALSALCGYAQNYAAIPDTIWGCRYFSYDYGESFPYNSGNKKGYTAGSWPTKDKVDMSYYARIPDGHVKATLVYNPRVNRAINLDVIITNQENKRVVYENTITVEKATVGGELSVELFPDMVFNADTWYKINFRPHDDKYTSAPSRIINILFNREANKPAVVVNEVFMAPSAHNNEWLTTEPYAPDDNTYDWIYGEFLYPEEYVLPARYLMCLGGSGYYSGIQSTNGRGTVSALFSAWDNGDTDVNPNLPDYLRSGAVDHNPDGGVEINRFGAEGTGIQSMMYPATWKPGHWVQWLMNARPETVELELPDKDGNLQTVKYANTILTAWYKMADDPDWYYVSTLRQSGTTHLFGRNGEYSFIECYGELGGDLFCRGYMKNRFYRSAGSGTWYNRNYMSGGHYDYNDGQRPCRYDYGHGATSLYENCFYIEQGGFGMVNDSSRYVAFPSSYECVDTIDLDSKQERINEAFRNANYNQTIEDIDQVGDDVVKVYAEELVNNVGKVGGYGQEHSADIIAAYNNGNPTDIGALKQALKQTALKYNKIRYANVTNKSHIGAQRAYVLDNTEGYGLLYVDSSSGTPVIKTADLDREDLRANWMIVRSDKYGTLCIRNIATGLYVNTEAENMLSAEPQNITAFARSGKGFYLGNTSTECVVAAADGSTSVGRFSATGGQYLLHDNLSMTPNTELVLQAVEECDAPGKFEEYKTMVPDILNTPEGVLGYWTNPTEKEQLSALYDDGNITDDKASELIALIDNAQKITVDTKKIGAFTILYPDAEANMSSLTIGDDNSLSNKSTTGKADQVWLGIPKQGGYELSSQGRAINYLTDKSGLTVTTKPEGEGAPIFFNPQSAGLHSISDVQYGPVAINGSGSAIKTANKGSEGNNWYIKPAETVKVTLNSGGITSLYLDFDVQIPEGVEVYTLAGFDNGAPTLTTMTGTIPAHTPVILKGENYAALQMPIIPAQTFPEEEGLMKGTLLKKTGLKSKTFYTVAVKSGKPCLALSLTNSVTANQCYILKEDMEALGLTENQYDFDFDSATAIKEVESQESGVKSGATYDLQGRPATEATQGIVIEKGKKIKR